MWDHPTFGDMIDADACRSTIEEYDMDATPYLYI
jgi:hypothetical protein